MTTNLALDDKLIEAARKAGNHRTQKDAVTAALAEYVQRRKQLRTLEAFGGFEFDPAYDYKAERRRRREERKVPFGKLRAGSRLRSGWQFGREKIPHL
ncbi:MAG: type II toxin-antitoxin system VapB family antitoxin [Terriglobales bacterium]